MATMSLLRCFIAIELPSSIHRSIERATADVRDRIGAGLVRWVPASRMHLTLKFLGDTAASGVSLIARAMDTELGRFQPFDILVKGLGTFPDTRRPRVLWVGIEAPPNLASLQHELDMATARLGYPSEDRSYSPHLTVGRVRENTGASGFQVIRDALEHAAVGELGMLTVDAIQLIKSELKPTGSVYTSLHTVRLTQT